MHCQKESRSQRTIQVSYGSTCVVMCVWVVTSELDIEMLLDRGKNIVTATDHARRSDTHLNVIFSNRFSVEHGIECHDL